MTTLLMYNASMECIKPCYIYWYHVDTHSNVVKDGYVGITTNPETRHYAHSTGRTNAHLKNAFAKYGDDIKKTILVIGSIDYCLSAEKLLRPSKHTGWNIEAGGGKPPINTGHSEETKQRIGAGNKGKTAGRISKFKGKTRHSDATRQLIGSYHKGKTISAEHRKAISEKMSGSDSPKAKTIQMQHIDALATVQIFGSLKEASVSTGVGYSALRSFWRARSKGFNRKGWRIVYI